MQVFSRTAILKSNNNNPNSIDYKTFFRYHANEDKGVKILERVNSWRRCSRLNNIKLHPRIASKNGQGLRHVKLQTALFRRLDSILKPLQEVTLINVPKVAIEEQENLVTINNLHLKHIQHNIVVKLAPILHVSSAVIRPSKDAEHFPQDLDQPAHVQPCLENPRPALPDRHPV